MKEIHKLSLLSGRSPIFEIILEKQDELIHLHFKTNKKSSEIISFLSQSEIGCSFYSEMVVEKMQRSKIEQIDLQKLMCDKSMEAINLIRSDGLIECFDLKPDGSRLNAMTKAFRQIRDDKEISFFEIVKCYESIQNVKIITALSLEALHSLLSNLHRQSFISEALIHRLPEYYKPLGIALTETKEEVVRYERTKVFSESEKVLTQIELISCNRAEEDLLRIYFSNSDEKTLRSYKEEIKQILEPIPYEVIKIENGYYFEIFVKAEQRSQDYLSKAIYLLSYHSHISSELKEDILEEIAIINSCEKIIRSTPGVVPVHLMSPFIRAPSGFFSFTFFENNYFLLSTSTSESLCP